MIPADFANESLYSPEAWFLHDVREIDREASRVVGVIDTTRLGALVDAQRPWKGHHKHLPGACAVMTTGTLGQLHAVYVLDLRATEGWIGFGTHIHKARFPKIGRIGPEVVAECRATRVRQIRGTYFVDYAFRFTQGDNLLYESSQTAAWVKPID